MRRSPGPTPISGSIEACHLKLLGPCRPHPSPTLSPLPRRARQFVLRSRARERREEGAHRAGDGKVRGEGPLLFSSSGAAMRTLNGAVGVITGAGSGIGRALALRLARERCDLAMADIDAAGLAETAVKARASRINLATHVVDVTDRAAMAEFRDGVLRA